MTKPKIATIKRGGSRFYVHPKTAEKVPGVTSVCNMLPKGFLSYWAAKTVATAAVDNIGAVVSLAMNDRGAAIDMLKRAPSRETDTAADTGTAVHEMLELLFRGEPVPRQHPDLQTYVDHGRAFMEAFKPEFLHVEATVWSERYHYAGSFDWIATIGGETVLGDNKTTRSGVHEEVALQLAAYRHADYILLPDGTTVDLPPGDAAAVFHIRPEAWQLVPVRVDSDVFDVFRHLLAVFEWDRETKTSVLGAPLKDLRTPSPYLHTKAVDSAAA